MSDRWEENLLAAVGRLAAPTVTEHRLFIALGAHWEVLPVLDRLAEQGLVRGRATGERRPEGRPIREWALTDQGAVRLGLRAAPVALGPRARLSPLASR